MKLLFLRRPTTTHRFLFQEVEKSLQEQLVDRAEKLNGFVEELEGLLSKSDKTEEDHKRIKEIFERVSTNGPKIVEVLRGNAYPDQADAFESNLNAFFTRYEDLYKTSVKELARDADYSDLEGDKLIEALDKPGFLDKEATRRANELIEQQNEKILLIIEEITHEENSGQIIEYIMGRVSLESLEVSPDTKDYLKYVYENRDKEGLWSLKASIEKLQKIEEELGVTADTNASTKATLAGKEGSAYAKTTKRIFREIINLAKYEQQSVLRVKEEIKNGGNTQLNLVASIGDWEDASGRLRTVGAGPAVGMEGQLDLSHLTKREDITLVGTGGARVNTGGYQLQAGLDAEKIIDDKTKVGAEANVVYTRNALNSDRIKTLTTRVEQLEQQAIDQNTAILDYINTNITPRQAEIKSLREQEASLRVSLSEATKTLALFQEALANQTDPDEIATLERLIDETEADIATLEGLITAISLDIGRLQTEITEQNPGLEELQEPLQTINDDLRSERDKLKTLRSERSTLGYNVALKGERKVGENTTLKAKAGYQDSGYNIYESETGDDDRQIDEQVLKDQGFYTRVGADHTLKVGKNENELKLGAAVQVGQQKRIAKGKETFPNTTYEIEANADGSVDLQNPNDMIVSSRIDEDGDVIVTVATASSEQNFEDVSRVIKITPEISAEYKTKPGVSLEAKVQLLNGKNIQGNITARANLARKYSKDAREALGGEIGDM